MTQELSDIERLLDSNRKMLAVMKVHHEILDNHANALDTLAAAIATLADKMGLEIKYMKGKLDS